MALGQILDGIGEPLHLHLAYDRPRHLRGPLVLYELADLRGLGVGTKGLVEEAYRRRNVVERCVGRLKQWRSVATRYEKRAVNYRAMVVIASLMVWLPS
jgi:hypothetical protein